jgi:hypothetical protein
MQLRQFLSLTLPYAALCAKDDRSLLTEPEERMTASVRRFIDSKP